MIWKKKITGCLLCFLLTVLTASSQYKLRPEIINYPRSLYEAQSQNWSITQDENGSMFFGNNEGLLNYNGAAWQLYRLPKNQIVRSVGADQHGRIYTGGFGSFGYWEKDPYTGYLYHSLNRLIKDPLFEEEEIWKIIVTRAQVLFQSFSRIYLLQGEKVKTIIAPGTILFTYYVRDHFYVNLLGKGIYKIDDNGLLAPVTSDLALNQKRVTCILPYGNNDLLVGTDKDGLYILNLQTGKYSIFQTSQDRLFKSAEINSGVKINDDLFAVGTISQGVLLLNAHGETVAWVNKANGLINNTVLGMMTDQAGNLWLAMDKGIAQLILKSDVAYYRDIQGRIGTVYSVAFFQNHIYVGSNHGLYVASFKSLEDFQLEDLEPFPGISGQVWDLKVIDGQLFCGNNTGTYVIKDQKASKIYSVTGGWDIQPIPASDPDHPGWLLQGTYNGVVVYKKKEDVWQYAHMLKGTQNMAINKIAMDQQGRLWVKHAYKGIYIIEPDKDFSRALNIWDLQGESVDNGTRLNFFHYGDSMLISGNNGIYRFDFNLDSLLIQKELEPKFQPFFKAEKVLTDSGKGFWFIDGSRQLFYKNWSSGVIQGFPLNNNLFSMVRGFENIIAITPSSSILTGEDGFVVLRKHQLALASGFSAPRVDQIRLTEQGKSEFLPAKYREEDGHIVLPYRMNNLIIDFSLPVYDRPVSFAYRMDKSKPGSWSDFSPDAQKEFNNLTPGSYHFQVKTQLSDEVLDLMIVVKNPWYFSILARIIYFLVFIGINILFLKWHQHRLKTQKLALTRKMQEALALEQEKNANRILLVQQEKLSEEVLHKSEDLAGLAMELIQRKKLMKKLRGELEAMKKQKDQGEVASRIQKLSKSLNKYIRDEENDWHLFDNGFNKVHDVFFEKLLQRFPELTAQDLRLAAYLKMNLTTKEIAPLLNISIRGVEIKRYRLRKKMKMDEHENLSDFMLKL